MEAEEGRFEVLVVCFLVYGLFSLVFLCTSSSIKIIALSCLLPLQVSFFYKCGSVFSFMLRLSAEVLSFWGAYFCMDFR